MDAKTKKLLKSQMTPRERRIARDLDLFERHTRGERPKELITEVIPRPVSKQVLREVRTTVLKMSQREAAGTFHVSPKTWIAWESGQNPVSGPASLWIEATKLFPKDVMKILTGISLDHRKSGPSWQR